MILLFYEELEKKCTYNNYLNYLYSYAEHCFYYIFKDNVASKRRTVLQVITRLEILIA